MICSVVVGVAFIPLVGRMADKINPQFTMPFAFFVRFCSIVGFYFIKNPASIYSYVISTLLVLGTLMEQVTNDALLFRNCDRQVRGIVYGIATSFGFLGQFLFCLGGGWLFDKISP